MPLPNRVDPLGRLHAVPDRGTLTGNRGVLHTPDRRIRWPFRGPRWILCLLDFRGRHRQVMTPGRWTELFFLDEATGLAAGHRPCAECQRERFLLFRRHWAAANPGRAGSPVPPAPVIDAALHADRLDGGRQRTSEARLGTLPAGAMVLLGDDENPMLVVPGGVRAWSFAGYGPRVPTRIGVRVRLLTPLSTVAAMADGFGAGLHPSAGG